MENVILQPLRPRNRKVRPVTLHLGQASLQLQVSEAKPGHLHVSSTAFEQWPLVPGQSIGLWQDRSGNHLHLGPVLGTAFEEPEPQIAAVRDAVKRHLGEASMQANVLLVCFSMHDVNLEHGTVMGQVYRGQGRWQSCKAPLPDVVYNRATYPDPEKRRFASKNRTYLRKVFSIPFINAVAGFNKLVLHQVLEFFPGIRGLMPATIEFHERETFEQFLQQHRTVFVKADSGTWGQQVLQVTAPNRECPQFNLRGYLRSLPVNETFSELDQLFEFMAAQRGQATWIVQQGIDLLTVEGRRFDVRLVLQKDGKGKWKFAQKLINWAGADQVVTNNRETADFLRASRFANKWPNGKAAFMELIVKAEHLCRTAAEALETKYGLLGEIGCDVGFDQDERPWLFEANAKPFLAPGVGVNYPFLYTKYLAKQTWAAQYDSKYLKALSPRRSKR